MRKKRPPYWRVLKAAERQFDPATTRKALGAAAKKLMRSNAELKPYWRPYGWETCAPLCQGP